MQNVTLPAPPAVILQQIRDERARRLASVERARLAEQAEEIRFRCRTLAGFAKEAWPILEPAAPLKWGWALDAICDHLEAVARGDISRLLVNVPPGMMKSLLTGVMLPAWEWAALARPSLRYLGTAHKEPLAIRDNMKCRRLIQSDWYRTLWPEVVLAGDQNAKSKFENTKTGFREAMAFSSLTGSRADRVLVDDPLSVDGSLSETDLRAAELTFTEALPTRVNDENSAIIVIMQRLHEKDTSGVILSRGLNYVHLRLPMRFERENACRTPIFIDPRTTEGELLFPERFSEASVSMLEASLGAYAIAGQLQQRPAPRDGGLFKRHWFETVDAVPSGSIRRVRRWDLAATKKAIGSSDPDWTVGLLLAKASDGTFYIEDVVRMRGDASEVERAIKATAAQDGRAVPVLLPQDPGQAGKMQAKYLVTQLAGYRARAEPETGSKITRADPVAAQAAVGNIKLLRGSWNAAFLDELSMFPSGHDDQVDALSGAFSALMGGGSIMHLL